MSDTYPGSSTGPIDATYIIPADGDDVDAASVNAALQQAADNDAYAKKVFPDLEAGGDYRALFPNGQVLIANSLVIDRSGFSDTTRALIVEGPTGANVNAIDVFGGGTTGRAARFTGGSSASAAVAIVGGSTTGDGLLVTAQAGDSTAITGTGHGSGSGIVANAGGTAGTPSVRAQSGPVLVDTNIAANTTDPGANMLWADAIPKSVGVGHSITAAGGSIVVDGGFNWTAVIHAGGTQIDVSFVHAMDNANFDVSVTVFGGGGALYAANPVGTNGVGGFAFQAAPLVPGSSVGALCNFTTTSYGFSFRVFGKQT